MLCEMIPLNELTPGQTGTVERVAGKRVIRRRFMEMGFVQGAQVLVERIAPLGDPVEFKVKGAHLSLRKADAGNILVKNVNGPTCD